MVELMEFLLYYNVFLLTDESGCEADMLEGAEGGRHSPPRPQQEPINLKNEVSKVLLQLSTLPLIIQRDKPSH